MNTRFTMLALLALGANSSFAEDDRHDHVSHKPVEAESSDLAFTTPEVGEPVDLSFTAIDGRRVSLREFRGKVVILHFWLAKYSTGGGATRLNELKALRQKFHNDGLEIIGFSLDRELGVLSETIESNGITWPQYFDGEMWKSRISSGLGISKLPTIWFVDRHGVLRNKDARLGGKPLEDAIKTLLAE